MRIEQNIISILAKCEVEGKTLKITEQLDRKAYAQLNKVLTAIGGKWNASKKAHIFKEDVSEMIENIINTGEYSCIKKDFQFFPTPIELAKKVVELAEVRPDDNCLASPPACRHGRVPHRTVTIRSVHVPSIPIRASPVRHRRLRH